MLRREAGDVAGAWVLLEEPAKRGGSVDEPKPAASWNRRRAGVVASPWARVRWLTPAMIGPESAASGEFGTGPLPTPGAVALAGPRHSPWRGCPPGIIVPRSSREAAMEPRFGTLSLVRWQSISGSLASPARRTEGQVRGAASPHQPSPDLGGDTPESQGDLRPDAERGRQPDCSAGDAGDHGEAIAATVKSQSPGCACWLRRRRWLPSSSLGMSPFWWLRRLGVFEAVAAGAGRMATHHGSARGGRRMPTGCTLFGPYIFPRLVGDGSMSDGDLDRREGGGVGSGRSAFRYPRRRLWTHLTRGLRAQCRADALVAQVCRRPSSTEDRGPPAAGRRSPSPSPGRLCRRDPVWLTGGSRAGSAPRPCAVWPVTRHLPLSRVITSRDGSPIEAGEAAPGLIPPALRRALEARDQGCTHPGC